MVGGQAAIGISLARCRKSNRAARVGAGGYWALVDAGEPFRLLFPLGALLGLVGVMMWPLYVAGMVEAHPGVAHARVMIEGFLTAFVMGFLGTALPRLLEAPGVRLAEALAYAGALVLVVALQCGGQRLAGDLIFVMMLAAFVASLGLRALWFRRDVPPPGFVLVAMGMVSALAGGFLQVVMQGMPGALPAWLGSLGRLLLHQGYLLFPVMGIGAFLLPRFFGLPNRQSFPESLAPSPGWKRSAAFALACGLVVLAGFVAESLGHLRWGNALRAGGLLVYFLREAPVHRAGFGGGSLAMGLRVALFSIPAAYALMAVWPAQTYSLLHVLFISGFSLLTFVVAGRVILGHSGQSEKFRARLWSIVAMTALVVLAMLTRVTADWMPDIRLSHYAYAALSWAVGVLVWACFILPGVRRKAETTNP